MDMEAPQPDETKAQPQSQDSGLQRSDSISQASANSQTAQDFIASQLKLEADAREVFPFQFDSCTKPLGALRQILFSCLSCNPPPTDPNSSYTPAGVCYSCSIACHGEHELVELFNKRNFACDCGTTRLPSISPCTLRLDEKTGTKGNVHSEEPAANKYNQNFKNRFCGCGQIYNAHTERGTMFQCLGLSTAEDGGCGEDWWHPECIMGLERTSEDLLKPNGRSKPLEESKPGSEGSEAAEEGIKDDGETPLPAGFPEEDSFEHFICYKCTEAFPWIKKYASKFVASVPYVPQRTTTAEAVAVAQTETSTDTAPPTSEGITSKKRKASDEDADGPPSPKKTKAEDSQSEANTSENLSSWVHSQLPAPPTERISLFLQEDFRSQFCRCPACFPALAKHPYLLDEEETYEPPVSESGDGDGEGGGSVGSRSLLDRGEAALSNMDRVRAIEGVMVYNHLRDKVKTFLQPFAESGKAVGAEDIKAYFEKLRGDEQAIKDAGLRASGGDGEDGADGDNRKEQSGY